MFISFLLKKSSLNYISFVVCVDSMKLNRSRLASLLYFLFSVRKNCVATLMPVSQLHCRWII